MLRSDLQVRLADRGHDERGDVIDVYAPVGTPGSVVTTYRDHAGRVAHVVDFYDGHPSGKPLRQHVLDVQLEHS